MATITLLKDPGVYSYYDFTVPRAALRLDELQSDNVMAIARSGNNDPVVAYLISAAWYTGQLALISSGSGTAPAVSIATHSDDFLGGNLSKLINLVNGTPEVAAQQTMFNADGTTHSAYKMFAFVRTAEFWEDPSFATKEQLGLKSSPGSAGTAASGSITLSAAPTAGDTVTVNGISVQFVASGATGNEVNIGISAAATATALRAFLSGSVNASLAAATYTNPSSGVVGVADKTVGTAGNSFTLAKSSTAIAVSGATLTGGVAGIASNGESLPDVQSTDQNIGGVVLGYLISPALYIILAAG